MSRTQVFETVRQKLNFYEMLHQHFDFSGRNSHSNIQTNSFSSMTAGSMSTTPCLIFLRFICSPVWWTTSLTTQNTKSKFRISLKRNFGPTEGRYIYFLIHLEHEMDSSASMAPWCSLTSLCFKTSEGQWIMSTSRVTSRRWQSRTWQSTSSWTIDCQRFSTTFRNPGPRHSSWPTVNGAWLSWCAARR